MDIQEPKPGYWGALPAQVRYADNLSASAKVLYAEISALANNEGYCFATNAYFERLYGVSDRTVSRLISALEQCGAIRVENGRGGKGQRRIYAGLNPMSAATPTKMSIPPDKNVGGALTKMSGVHNIENRKYNIPPKSPKGICAWEPELFERFWKAYPRKKDKDKARQEWDKLRPDRKLMRTMSAALERDKQSEEWQRDKGKYVPYACRWLSHRRWEDEPDGTAEPVAETGQETTTIVMRKGDYEL